MGVEGPSRCENGFPLSRLSIFSRRARLDTPQGEGGYSARTV